MNKYKVEIKETITYAIDVLAKNEQQAEEIAREKWQDFTANGTYHHYAIGDPETSIGNIYDITNTDDPFNP